MLDRTIVTGAVAIFLLCGIGSIWIALSESNICTYHAHTQSVIAHCAVFGFRTR